jgi:hypothetical protein
MEYIGIDVHKRDSQACVITRKGEVLEQRFRAERKSFAELKEAAHSLDAPSQGRSSRASIGVPRGLT